MSFVLLPEFSNEAANATLRRWLVKAGDTLEPGQALGEFEIENGDIVIEAASPGRISELLVKPGQTVTVGAKIARVEVGSAQASSPGVQGKEIAVADTAATVAGGKVVPILMPQAGNTMEEGTVVAWRVAEGEQVTVGQVICEIETDKATMDFESPDAGRLARIVAQLDEPVAVKNVIAILAENDADADAFLAGQGKSGAPAAPMVADTVSATTVNHVDQGRPQVPAQITAEGRVKASPAARKLAAERGLSLSEVGGGSGPGGRILSSDLEGLAAQGSSIPTSGGEIRRPMSKMRRAIGLNLQQSKQTVPHFYVRSTINADALLKFYRVQKQETHCSLNDIVVLAVGRAMREFPAVRSQIVGNEIIEYPHANIGIAVGIDDGLVVPVVLDVDTLPLSQLAAETKRVVEQARKGRLENIGKGHFTISNLGMFGVEEFSAIINPPESGILAVSAARETVIVEKGAMRVGHQMTMTLSADHRIVDGVMAAKFMQRLRAVLEHPEAELV